MILALPAYAKLNLSLAVHGLRPDGHHEVTTVLQAISLHDLVIVERAAATEVHGGHPDDLVLKAQLALERAIGRSLPARFLLVKRIPVAAGLGGGSSDAATALRALSTLYELSVDLLPIAAELGADVPFFLVGGAAVGTGRGDQLQPLPPVGGWFALAWPDFPVSTEAIYRRWDEVGGEGDNQLTMAALDVDPRLADFAARMQGWRMTGSGGAFFKACLSEAEAALEAEAANAAATATAGAATAVATGAPGARSEARVGWNTATARPMLAWGSTRS